MIKCSETIGFDFHVSNQCTPCHALPENIENTDTNNLWTVQEEGMFCLNYLLVSSGLIYKEMT